MIKRVGECLQIDVCRVHVLVKFWTCIGGNVAGGDGDSFDSPFAAGLRHVDRVFGENHRIIVSERNRSAAEPLRRERDLLGRGRVREFVPFARFGDVPVLTKPAAEIASSRAK